MNEIDKLEVELAVAKRLACRWDQWGSKDTEERKFFVLNGKTFEEVLECHKSKQSK